MVDKTELYTDCITIPAWSNINIGMVKYFNAGVDHFRGQPLIICGSQKKNTIKADRQHPRDYPPNFHFWEEWFE